MFVAPSLVREVPDHLLHNHRIETIAKGIAVCYPLGKEQEKRKRKHSS